MLKSILLTCIVLLMFSMAAHSENNVSTKLVSNVETAEPGVTIQVGVLFDLPPRSHIYWRNPGESGLATGVEWSVGDALEVGDLQWPVPKQFEIEGLDESYFGYTDQVLLFSRIAIPKSMSDGDTLTIRAKVHWLLCLDDGVCIPEDAELSLEIPVHAQSRVAWDSSLFLRQRTVWKPMDIPGRFVKVTWKKDSPELIEITPAGGLSFANSTESPRFFPGTGGPWIAEISAEKITFRPKYKGEDVSEGILSLSVEEKSSGKRSLYNLRVSVVESP